MPATKEELEAIRSDSCVLQSLGEYFFTGSRLSDVCTAIAGGLFLYSTEPTVEIGSAFAFAGAIASTTFKVGSFMEHSKRQEAIVRSHVGARTDVDVRKGIKVQPDSIFYIAVILSFLGLALSPALKLAAIKYQDNDQLQSKLPYMILIGVGIILSVAVDIMVRHYGEKRTKGYIEFAIASRDEPRIVPPAEAQIIVTDEAPAMV
ncbi:MAG: hypothetical protein Q7V63_07910 [Gammaproteobacteria bacterium]|nr:hypothetical protein [Gammaproteobacteria bacterium]